MNTPKEIVEGLPELCKRKDMAPPYEVADVSYSYSPNANIENLETFLDRCKELNHDFYMCVYKGSEEEENEEHRGTIGVVILFFMHDGICFLFEKAEDWMIKDKEEDETVVGGIGLEGDTEKIEEEVAKAFTARGLKGIATAYIEFKRTLPDAEFMDRYDVERKFLDKELGVPSFSLARDLEPHEEEAYLLWRKATRSIRDLEKDMEIEQLKKQVISLGPNLDEWLKKTGNKFTKSNLRIFIEDIGIKWHRKLEERLYQVYKKKYK